MTNNVATTALEDPSTLELSEPQQKPTGEAGQREARRQLWRSEDSSVAVGIWECEPGTFTAAREGYGEICQIISGSATVIPDGGSPIHLQENSVLITPDGWKGTWHVHEKIRKMAVIHY